VKRETIDVVSMMELATDELRAAIWKRVIDLVVERKVASLAATKKMRVDAKVIHLRLVDGQAPEPQP